MTRLPVTTVGGYLGAGKTTLINHMLRHADGRRLAVLVNEFGALAIDEDLIEARDDQMISIAGGCICCSFGDNLIGTLGELAKMTPRPDHILIEASGVAIPQSIAASISLVQDFQLNGVVVLADVETVQTMAQDKYLGDTITRQITGGDLIILSKTDLKDVQFVQNTRDWIKTIVGHDNIIPTIQGAIPNEILLGLTTDINTLTNSPHSDTDFESIILEISAPVDARELAKTIATSGLGVARCKGFVRDISGDLKLIQIVGQRFEVTEVHENQRLGVVCIGLRGQMNTKALHAFAQTNALG